MKLQRYRFEQEVQEVNENTKEWLKGEFISILESNKPYESKCDYIGYSILSIDEKIKLIENEIKELISYKRKLIDAKEISLTCGAEVFQSYGISKIEGGGISSITLTSKSTKAELLIIPKEEEGLIDAGFYKKVLDMELVRKYYNVGEYKDIIAKYCTIEFVEKVSVSKLRINKRRNPHTQMKLSDIIDQIEQKDVA